MNKYKKAYNEIFNVLGKHKDICIFDIPDLRYMADCHLFGLELKNKYGLNIKPTIIKSLEWNVINSHIIIGLFGKDGARHISWEDNCHQPDNELLLSIKLPAGAYISGEYYSKEVFFKFFNELKNYPYKYISTKNYELYFTLNNAKDVFNNFDSIYKKYCEIAKNDREERKIKQLEDELKKRKMKLKEVK